MSMRQVTLHIPESSYAFFMELAKSLSFVKKIEEEKTIKIPSQESLLQGMKEAVQELNDIKAGRLKGIDAKALLDEL